MDVKDWPWLDEYQARHYTRRLCVGLVRFDRRRMLVDIGLLDSTRCYRMIINEDEFTNVGAEEALVALNIGPEWQSELIAEIKRAFADREGTSSATA